jgi:O-antigen ligase
VRILVLIVCWTLFAFPHYYRATVLPLACGIVLLAVFRPPAIELFEGSFWSRRRLAAQFLDFALILSLAAIACQLVPLSLGLRSRIAPAAMAYDRAMRLHENVENVTNLATVTNVAPLAAATAAPTRRPLSIAPGETLLALIVVAAIVLLFWCSRAMFERGGVRATIRAVAWIGLFVSPLAIVQHIIPLPFVDGVWGLTARGLRPFGPFVNRNDFAGWLIMAIPLTAGYAVARMQSRHRAGEAVDAETLFDSKSIWLAMAVCLMAAGLLGSLSRSGLAGAFAGLVFFALISRRRVTARRAGLAIAGIGVALAIASAFADMGALSTRFMEGSVSEGLSGRVSIWRQTWPIVRDFWPFGAGVGAYRAVMVPYQTMSKFFAISHADNEFLQILAEGGLLLALPVAMALLAGGFLAAKRLREDRTPIFWVRAGAAAGIVALATQNMIEMTLRVPANAVLFAILAAITIHYPALSDSAKAASKQRAPV